MSEMIARVAKAQFLNAHEGDPPESWDLLDDDYRALWLKAARVGVEAMREPTEAMEGGWRPMSQSPAHYVEPWDCGRVLIYSHSPAIPDSGHIHLARWSIPYEGAPTDRCWWETNLTGCGHRSEVVPAFVTHWMPLPDPPAA